MRLTKASMHLQHAPASPPNVAPRRLSRSQHGHLTCDVYGRGSPRQRLCVAARNLADTLSGVSAGAVVLAARYGPEAERKFQLGWRQHIDFFLWYAKGVMTDNDRLQKRAVDGLERYASHLAAFISSANPNLPREAVAGLLRGPRAGDDARCRRPGGRRLRKGLCRAPRSHSPVRNHRGPARQCHREAVSGPISPLSRREQHTEPPRKG